VIPSVRVFVQARMSSRRFPGKVLAPFRGQPIIKHVLETVRRALSAAPTVVATSLEPSDDPLVAYLGQLQTPCFRGPLDDVLGRFRACLAEYPCAFVLRICADSPLLDEDMLRQVVEAEREHVDLVTTTLERTFPRGSNAELIRATTLTSLPESELTAHDREHVTPFIHRHPERFRILNVQSGDPGRAALSVAVDTIEDLNALEGRSER
jgi:spore coat polysaccharide biosynthesis protein SpsF